MVVSNRSALASAARPLRAGETRTHEGGIAHAVDKWTRLERFLILGTASGTFYVGKRELTIENAAVVRECLDEDPVRTLNFVAIVSDGGRAKSNEPALMALAIALRHRDLRARKMAEEGFNVVVRTGTDLLHIASYVQATATSPGPGGKLSSSVIRRTFGNWFLTMDPEKLAYQAVKYASRDGWSMEDVLRQVSPKAAQGQGDTATRLVRRNVLWWITKSKKWAFDERTPLPNVITARDALHKMPGDGYVATAEQLDLVAQVVRMHRVPREAVPTKLLNSPLVWDALLDDMPMGAMLRNLAKMTSIGLLTDDVANAATLKVVSAFSDQTRIQKARLHPMAILQAAMVYAEGRGERGSLTWTPCKRIVDVLDAAFYLSFKTIEPSGKRILIAMDVSTSMDQEAVLGMNMSARVAAAAMALVTIATEPNAEVVAFSHAMVPVTIAKDASLEQVVRGFRSIPMGGGTYTSLPIQDAINRHKAFDAIAIYTDNETMDGNGSFDPANHPSRRWYGGENPATKGSTADWLRRYRNNHAPGCRFVTVGCTATEVSIADPHDRLSLDVVGFDAAVPGLISDFVAGRVLA